MADTQETATSTENLRPVELTIHDYHGRDTRYVLHKLPAVIGRDDQADVQLMDPWVSHRHCEIDQIGDVLVVRDLNSRNGVFIHHYRVGKSELASGDQLIIGRTEVTVRYLGRAQVAIEAEVSKPPEQKLEQARPPETLEFLY